jgi:hypothetical protein
MSKLIVLFLIFLSTSFNTLLAQRFTKVLKEQPLDILDENIGVIISDSEFDDSKPIAKRVTDTLISLGYNVVAVKKLSKYETNKQPTIEAFKSQNVKYVCLYFEEGPYYVVLIATFSENELYDLDKGTVFYKTNEAGVYSDRGFENVFKEVVNGSELVTKTNMMANKEPFNRLALDESMASFNNKMPRLIDRLPETLNDENLAVLMIEGSKKQKYVISTIMLSYPHKYHFTSLDTLGKTVKAGARYLLTYETGIQKAVSYSKILGSNQSNNLGAANYNPTTSILYYPMIKDLITGDVYYQENIKGAVSADFCYYNFINEVKKQAENK